MKWGESPLEVVDDDIEPAVESDNDISLPNPAIPPPPPPPAPRIVDIIVEVTSGLKVKYTPILSGGDISSYEWQYGDGGISSGNEKATRIYGAEGTYNVSLKVSNAGGFDSMTKEVYLEDLKPGADYSLTQQGRAVGVENTSTFDIDGDDITWNFGDGSPEKTGDIAYHTYGADGQYIIQMTIGNYVISKQVNIAGEYCRFLYDLNVNRQFTGVADFVVGELTSIVWTMGDGTTFDGLEYTTVNHTYALGDDYHLVTLKINGGVAMGGYEDIVSIVMDPWTTVFEDNCVETPGVNLEDHIADTGQAWETYKTGWDGYKMVAQVSDMFVGVGGATYKRMKALPAVEIMKGQSGQKGVKLSCTILAGVSSRRIYFGIASSPQDTCFADGFTLRCSDDEWYLLHYKGGCSEVQNIHPTEDTGGSGTYYVTIEEDGVGGWRYEVNPPNGPTVSGSIPAGRVPPDTIVPCIYTYRDVGLYRMKIEDKASFEPIIDGESNEYANAPATIIPYPNAGFTAEPVDGDEPLNVGFTNTSIGIDSSQGPILYEWDFGDGETSNEKNPSHTFLVAGWYKVSLKVTNKHGYSTYEGVIAVYYAPTGDVPDIQEDIPWIDITPDNYSGQAPLSVIFTNNTLNADSYLWTFGDGDSSTDTSPMHTFRGRNTYIVTLQATNNTSGVVITKSFVIQTYFNSVKNILAGPPPAPSDGDAYLINTGAYGAWANYQGYVAIWDQTGGSWVFYFNDMESLVYSSPPGSPSDGDTVYINKNVSATGVFTGYEGEKAVYDELSSSWNFYDDETGLEVRNGPPVSRYEGLSYKVGQNPTGDWSSYSGYIARWTNNAWHFFDATTGYEAYVNPPSAQTGNRFLIAPNATGAWSGKDGQIAEWSGSTWLFYDEYTDKQILIIPPVSPSTGDSYVVGDSATGVWSGYDGSTVTWDGGEWDFTEAKTNIVVVGTLPGAPIEGTTVVLSIGASSDFVGDKAVYTSGVWIYYDLATGYESLSTPPGGPSTNDMYVVGDNPTGAWVGHEDEVARWIGSTWTFTAKETEDTYGAAVIYIIDNATYIETTGSSTIIEVTVEPSGYSQAVPIVDLTTSTFLTLSGKEVEFTADVVVGAATFFSWNFGDGNVSSAQNPKHRFTRSGIFTIEVQAHNSAGYGKSIITVIVYDINKAQFSSLFFYVADRPGDKLVLFDISDGAFNKNVGSSGSGSGKFDQPTDCLVVK